MTADDFDLIRVPAVGLSGLTLTITLADVAALVSIAVGLVTFGYVLTKWILLFKRRGP